MAMSSSILGQADICLAESGGFVFDRDITSSGALVLIADEIGDLLILGLLNGGFIALIALVEYTA